MKLLIALTLAALAAGSYLYFHNKQTSTSQNVVNVDIARYVGLWYEIAHLPIYFETNCYCTTANYTLNPDDSVTIFNSCNLKSPEGKLREAKGKATPNYPVNGTVTVGDLNVKFGFIDAGSYLILALDQNYDYALIGSNSKKALVILSRTQTLDQNITSQLLSVATQEGYDVSNLVYTYQGNDCEYYNEDDEEI